MPADLMICRYLFHVSTASIPAFLLHHLSCKVPVLLALLTLKHSSLFISRPYPIVLT